MDLEVNKMVSGKLSVTLHVASPPVCLCTCDANKTEKYEYKLASTKHRLYRELD